MSVRQPELNFYEEMEWFQNKVTSLPKINNFSSKYSEKVTF